MIANTIGIIIFASLLILGFLLLTNPLGVNIKANRWFGWFFVIWGIYWVENLSPEINEFVTQHFISVPLNTVLFCGPILLYFGIIFFTNPNHKLGKRFYLYCLAPVAFFALQTARFFSPENDTLFISSIGFNFLNGIFFATASLVHLRKYQKRIPYFSSSSIEIDLNWLVLIIVSIMILAVTIVVYNILFFKEPPGIVANTITLGIAYFAAYYSLKQKEIYPKDETQRKQLIAIKEPDSNNKRKLLDDETLVKQKSNLLQIMQEQEPHLDSEINLSRLAEALKVTPHQLSYLLNTGFNENFFQFINRHRIEKAKILLATPQKQNLSMLGIAYESGFNSKTVFNTTFKKNVGSTPSDFRLKNTK